MNRTLLQKMGLLWLCVCMLAGMWMPATAMAGSNLVDVVNNPNPSDRLNLRIEPRTSATTLGKYYNGVEVLVLEYVGNDWLRVRIGDTEGYMQRRFVAIGVAPGSVRSAIPYATVHNPNPSDRLNLRAWMSQAAQSLGKYSNGTRVEVLGYSETWCHVRVDGRIGYMQSSFLQIDGQKQGNPQPSGSTWAVVNNPNPTDRLNLRDSVGPRGEAGSYSMGKYYNGVDVEILSYLTGSQSGWAFVRIGNTHGYMQTRFLVTGEAAAYVRSMTPSVVVSNPKPGDRLNLRDTPAEGGRSLGKFNTGTKVEVLGVTSDGWCHVSVQGQIGYMRTRYLSPQPKF